MNQNPYAPYATLEGGPTNVRSSLRDRVISQALLSAVGAFGVAFLVLAVLVPFVWHGEWQIFPLGDSAYFMYFIVASLCAGIVFASTMMRALTKSRWVPPLACVIFQVGTAVFLYQYGTPVNSRGAFDLTALFALCVLGLTPCVVGFTMLRLAGRTATLVAFPYLVLGCMFAYQVMSAAS